MDKSNETKTPNQLSDKDRILLFEWHARHLESWWQTIRPKKLEINFPKGMETTTFHLVSISVLLLRKFLASGHEVYLPTVYESIRNELPEDKRSLRRVLNAQKHELKEYMRQSTTVSAPDQLRPDEIAYEVAYGLLIHSDADRFQRLVAMDRGWMHDMLFVGEGHIPVFRTLRTIEECRNDGSLQLPEPHEAIWEQSEPEGMTIEEAREFLQKFGF